MNIISRKTLRIGNSKLFTNFVIVEILI